MRVCSMHTCIISVACTHYNTLQHTGTHCNTLQHTATHFSTLQYTAPHCNILQRTATHCTTLQHTATHCNTLHACSTHVCMHTHIHTCVEYSTSNTRSGLLAALSAVPLPPASASPFPPVPLTCYFKLLVSFLMLFI